MNLTKNSTMNYGEVLDVLRVALSAIQIWGKPAFEQVKIYDLLDLKKALEELLVTKNRVCLLIPGGEEWDRNIHGAQLICHQTRQVTLLMADRNYTDRLKAMLGDLQTPGVFTLSAHVLPAVCGRLADRSFVVEPDNGELFALEGDDRANNPGRICWRQELAIKGGTMQFNLGQPPIY